MKLFGQTAGGVDLPLLVDATGAAIISAPAAGIVVKPPFSNYWDAISAAYAATKNNTALPAGYSALVMVATPAGILRTITVVDVCYIGTVAAVTLYLSAYIGGVTIIYGVVSPPVSARHYPFIVNLTLAPADTIFCQIYGATLNDDCYLYACGRDVATA